MILLPHQERILRDPAPRKVISAGRRTGKSTMIALDAVERAIRNPGFKGLILCPTTSMKDDMVRLLLKAAEGWDFSISNMENLHFDNDATIRVRTANANCTIGLELDKIWMEEPDLFKEPMGTINACQTSVDSHPDKQLLILGTPINKPSVFRTLWLRGFLVTMLPVWTIPGWTKELEDQLTVTAGSIFAHEFLGAF